MAQMPRWWSRLLTTLLPWLVILAIIVFFWQRMQKQMGGGQQGGGLFGMGKSKARRYSRDDPRKTFDDVAGSDSAKWDLLEEETLEADRITELLGLERS